MSGNFVNNSICKFHKRVNVFSIFRFGSGHTFINILRNQHIKQNKITKPSIFTVKIQNIMGRLDHKSKGDTEINGLTGMNANWNGRKDIDDFYRYLERRHSRNMQVNKKNSHEFMAKNRFKRQVKGSTSSSGLDIDNVRDISYS